METIAPATATSSVFNRSKHFDIPVPHPDFPDGKKFCTVRFPTDAEWCQRSKSRITQRRQLERDAVKVTIPNLEAVDKTLFDKIRVDTDGPEFDPAEAMRVIERLERCQVTDVERVGAAYRVTLKVLGGFTVTHTLKIPTERQVMDFGHAAISVIGRRQVQETRVMLEPSGELWGKLLVAVEGYGDTESDLVPVIHKDTAITELLQAIRLEVDGDDPEA